MKKSYSPYVWKNCCCCCQYLYTIMMFLAIFSEQPLLNRINLLYFRVFMYFFLSIKSRYVGFEFLFELMAFKSCGGHFQWNGFRHNFFRWIIFMQNKNETWMENRTHDLELHLLVLHFPSPRIDRGDKECPVFR